MEKHFLLAIGDDQTSYQAGRFVEIFFHYKHPVRLTLLYVAPKTPDISLDRGEVYQKQRIELDWNKRQEQRAGQLLEKGREMLLRAGFQEKNVNVRLVFSQYGSARDLIQESVKGLFDALVLGRRGLSRFEELFVASVTKTIINEELTFPIWVCQRPERGRRNILLAVDGSEPCVQIADHVGFVAADQPEHAITLIHVRKNSASAADEHQAFFETALRSLLDNGVARERIQSKVLVAAHPAQAILEEAARERYAVVAVGRTGTTGSGLFSMGSVSRTLLSRLEGAALWVSPSACAVGK
ncbi:MAG TPA: universal stress protein [Desulfonatronum sp.]|nr:universal stress protein [Desulfonatronum sp.]